MSTAIRKHWRDFVAIIVLLVIALIVGGIILANQRFSLPAGVPVLFGQLDGGEGRVSDSGLRIDSDRVLVRVVGYGGRP